MELLNVSKIMKKQKIPKKPDFTTQELLELWNNCPDKVICTKIANYVQQQQSYITNKINK